MPISIKNDETERLARKLAKLTGETLTDVIRDALAEKYERLNSDRTRRARIDELNQIALRCASLPRISNLSDDEILGYDENGLPT
jgi:antitoxin VapB